MVVNPSRIEWTNPSSYVDGVEFTQECNAGYELQIDGKAVYPISATWATSFDLTSFKPYLELKTGIHSWAIRAVTQGGQRSDYSAATTFRREAPPCAPTNLLAY